MSENWLSIDNDDKEYETEDEYSSFKSFLTEDRIRNHKSFSNFIVDNGVTLLDEINGKEKKKIKLIDYIISKSINYESDILYTYSLNDVRDIYNEIKYLNRPWYVKMFELFINQPQ